jgi:hypothetical protein
MRELKVGAFTSAITSVGRITKLPAELACYDAERNIDDAIDHKHMAAKCQSSAPEGSYRARSGAENEIEQR